MGRFFAWILGIGTFVGAIYLWLSKRNDISDLKTALQVQKTREQVARLEAIQADRLADASTTQGRIDGIAAAIASRKAEAVALAVRVDLSGKSDDEIAAIFTKSGL